MGREVKCVARDGARRSAGTALLESSELRFRGDFRLTIPVRDVTSAVATDGELHVRHCRGMVVFELGPAAASWADRLSHPKSVVDKLGVQPGQRVSAIGPLPGSLLADVAARLGEPPHRRATRESDIIFLSANGRVDLRRLATLRPRLAPAGALWVVRPKGVAAITERDVMAAGKAAGLVDVKVVSISETHTGEKFVIPKSARLGMGERGS